MYLIRPRPQEDVLDCLVAQENDEAVFVFFKKLFLVKKKDQFCCLSETHVLIGKVGEKN